MSYDYKFLKLCKTEKYVFYRQKVINIENNREVDEFSWPHYFTKIDC